MMFFQSSVQIGKEQREQFQVLPGTQRNLTKISAANRRLVLKIALCFSSLATSTVLIGTVTNNWLYTSEWLKYYQPKFTNITVPPTKNEQKKYFKNATIGPWVGCFSDPERPFYCRRVVYWNAEEPSDVTESVEQAVIRATYFLVGGAIANTCGLLLTMVNNVKTTFYPGILANSIIHIFSGMFIFLCLIVYMASLAQEVGRKLYPASPMDDPLFYYQYGYSFISIMFSFLCTEFTALFTLMVYMANRDEKIFQRFHIQQLVQKKMIPSMARTEKSSSQRPSRSSRGSYMRAFSPRLSDQSAVHCPAMILPIVLEDNRLKPVPHTVNGEQCYTAVDDDDDDNEGEHHDLLRPPISDNNADNNTPIDHLSSPPPYPLESESEEAESLWQRRRSRAKAVIGQL